MIFRGHGYWAEEETGEGGVPVENVATLCVHVEEIEGRCRSAGLFRETGFYTAEELFEDRSFEGVEEKGEGGSAG